MDAYSRHQLKILYERAGKPRKKLAEILGVNPRTINRWLNGERNPSPEHLRRFASLLLVHAIERDAKESGLSGGHELVGMRRDVWRRYMRGDRAAAPEYAFRFARVEPIDLATFSELYGEAWAKTLRRRRPERAPVPTAMEVPFIVWLAMWRAGELDMPTSGVEEIRREARRSSEIIIYLSGRREGGTFVVEHWEIV